MPEPREPGELEDQAVPEPGRPARGRTRALTPGRSPVDTTPTCERVFRLLRWVDGRPGPPAASQDGFAVRLRDLARVGGR